MPEVFVEAVLATERGKTKEKLLLNTGARGVELAIRKSTAKKIGLKTHKKMGVYPIGPKILGDVGQVEVTIENPQTKEKRVRLLEAIVLPDKFLDCSLLGVVGQEKLGVTPDVRIGKPIF